MMHVQWGYWVSIVMLSVALFHKPAAVYLLIYCNTLYFVACTPTPLFSASCCIVGYGVSHLLCTSAM